MALQFMMELCKLTKGHMKKATALLLSRRGFVSMCTNAVHFEFTQITIRQQRQCV